MTATTIDSPAVGVRIGVSAEGAMSASALSFTGPSSLVTELAQNARRAGATRVDITFDARTRCLTVADDGCGVEDLGRMFDLYGRDGWSDPGVAAEQPFGIGMAAALHYGTHVVVRSRGRRLDVPCATAKAFGEFFHVADPEPVTVGTVVRVEGVERIGQSKESHGLDLFVGFPLEVTFNGHPVPRPNADGAEFIDTPLGRLRMPPLEQCARELKTHRFSDRLFGVEIYWGGFQVLPSRRSSPCCVLHLRPGAWPMRAPDRRMPQDAAGLHDAARKMMLTLRNDELGESFRRSGQTETEYVLEHYLLLDSMDKLAWAKRLLTAAQAVPAAWVSRLSAPIDRGCASEDYLVSLPGDGVLTRQQAEDGSAPVIEAGAVSWRPDTADETIMTLWCALTNARIVKVGAYGVDAGHWLDEVMVSLDGPGFDDSPPHLVQGSDPGPALTRPQTQAEREREPSVSVYGAQPERATTYIGHDRDRVRVMPCAAIAVEFGGWRATTVNHAVWLDSVLYVPPGAGRDAILQAVNYYDSDDESYDSDGAEAEESRFAAVLPQIHGGGPREILQRMLDTIDWRGFEVLDGLAFRVTCTRATEPSGYVCSPQMRVELLPSDEAAAPEPG